MTYISPIETESEDSELASIDKTTELNEQKFNFSMFFVLGLVLILIGFFRMLFFQELNWLNVGFVALGFVISLSSQTWMKGKELTVQEEEMIQRRKEIQYELADGNTGFSDQDLRNEKRIEYLRSQEKAGVAPDVKHREKDVDIYSEASFDPERKELDE